MINVEKVKPTGLFTNYIYKAIPLAFDESMSYYETLCGLLAYLKDTILPVINNNADATIELENMIIELQNYVDNYFENLDVQDEINNKLDEMAEQGQLADIIAQYLQLAGVLAFNTLNDLINAENITNGSICKTLGENTYNDGKGAYYKIRTITSGDVVDNKNIIALNISNTLIAELIINSNINDVINYIEENEYYDILKHGGFDDGITPNDTIFNNAKNNGIRKFYFPQNATGNANYYFTNYAFFNDCEVKTDNNVIINFPNISNIDSTKTAKYVTNVEYHSRAQNKNFLTPSNITDYFNHFKMQNYTRKLKSLKDLSGVKLYLYTYDTTGLYTDSDSSKNDCFQEIDYNIRYKANAYLNILGVPIDATKYDCVEIVTTPNTKIYFGCLNSTSLDGIFNDYDGENPQNYYYVNGNTTPTKSDIYTKYPNFWKHYVKNETSNDYTKHMKYKLKNNPIKKQIELYINDIFTCAYPWGTTEIDYMGFGIKSEAGISSANGFSYISTYEEETTPLNSSLNILLIGDSRCYGFNSQYKIEDIIKCGLISNGINNVNINNISESGYTITDITNALNDEDLTNYDIVITATGINDYNATYKSILDAIFNINQIITNSHCYSLMCATIPACYDATDPLGDARAEMYYKIENSILSGTLFNDRFGLVKYIPNVMGNTNYENLIPMCNDGVHPTTLGSIQFAKAIVNEILNLFN